MEKEKTYHCIRSSQINRFFPNCIPCACCFDRDMVTEPVGYYSVTMHYGKRRFETGAWQVITIDVECANCEAKKTYDVRQYDVYSSDIKW